MIGDDFQVIPHLSAGYGDVFVLAFKPGLIVERTLQHSILGVPESERTGAGVAGPRNQIAAKDADRTVFLSRQRAG